MNILDNFKSVLFESINLLSDVFVSPVVLDPDPDCDFSNLNKE